MGLKVNYTAVSTRGQGLQVSTVESDSLKIIILLQIYAAVQFTDKPFTWGAFTDKPTAKISDYNSHGSQLSRNNVAKKREIHIF